MHLVRRYPLAKAHLGLVTRNGRAREIAEGRARSWAKSARQQRAQTLKILPPIHNDLAGLDIFEFTPQIQNIQECINNGYLFTKAEHFWYCKFGFLLLQPIKKTTHWEMNSRCLHWLSVFTESQMNLPLLFKTAHSNKSKKECFWSHSLLRKHPEKQLKLNFILMWGEMWF